MAVFLQVITLFLLIFCGFFSAKGKLVDENGISTLNKIVLYFALPALTLYGLQKDASPELIHQPCHHDSERADCVLLLSQ